MFLAFSVKQRQEFPIENNVYMCGGTGSLTIDILNVQNIVALRTTSRSKEVYHLSNASTTIGGSSSGNWQLQIARKQ